MQYNLYKWISHVRVFKKEARKRVNFFFSSFFLSNKKWKSEETQKKCILSTEDRFELLNWDSPVFLFFLFPNVFLLPLVTKESPLFYSIRLRSCCCLTVGNMGMVIKEIFIRMYSNQPYINGRDRKTVSLKLMMAGY